MLLVNNAVGRIDTLTLFYQSKFFVVADYYENEIKPNNLLRLKNNIECEFVENNIKKYYFLCLKLTIKNIVKYKQFIYYKKLDSLNSKKTEANFYYNREIFDDWLAKNLPKEETDTIAFYERIIGQDNLKKINCEFVLAYNWLYHSFFKLSGFKINEFYDFFNLISMDIINIIYNEKIAKKIFKTNCWIRKTVLSEIYIKDIDVDDLYKKYYISSKVYPADDNSYTNKKYILKLF
jgi:hypothetical protein